MTIDYARERLKEFARGYEELLTFGSKQFDVCHVKCNCFAWLDGAMPNVRLEDARKLVNDLIDELIHEINHDYYTAIKEAGHEESL